MEEEAGVPDREDEPDVKMGEVAQFKYILDEEAGIRDKEEEGSFVVVFDVVMIDVVVVVVVLVFGDDVL